MTSLFAFWICFFSCIVGAICGVGGGVIIKPLLDAFGIMDIAAINFLSGCTVFSMTLYSVIRSRISGNSRIERTTGIPLAMGAAAGGILGKNLFQWILSVSEDINRTGTVQSVCLLAVTVGTLLYVLCKNRIKTHQIKNRFAYTAIGLVLGIMSAFLGIGGGPINLVVLFFFASMDTKTAAENSLYMILVSQTASILYSILTRTVPAFPPEMLFFMVGGGISGGICGRGMNRRLDALVIDRLFIALMVLMIGINLYNLCQFFG